MDILDLREKNDNGPIPQIPTEPSGLKKVTSFIWEIVKIVVISLAIIIPIRMFVVQPFIVEGASMQPNFHDGEYLIVDEISYRFSAPKRGDAVIFHPPQNLKVYYIKRIIGLPGETVELKDGSIYIYNSEYMDGVRLSEIDYTIDNKISKNEKDKVTLAQDEYYLVGDNRLNSLDSRRFGAVKLNYIKGRAWLRAFPFNRFTIFEEAEYGL